MYNWLKNTYVKGVGIANPLSYIYRVNNKKINMNRVDKKQLAFLKKQYFNSKQKTHCKKLEQQGGVFKFVVEDKSYKIYYKSTEAYTDFVFNSIKHRTGSMNRGASLLVQDSYGKITYQEHNMINKLDRKLSKSN